MKSGWVAFGSDGLAVATSESVSEITGSTLARWRERPWPLTDERGNAVEARLHTLETIRNGKPHWKTHGHHHGDWVAWSHSLYIPVRRGGQVAGGVILTSSRPDCGGPPGRCARCEAGAEHTVECACRKVLCWSCAREHDCAGFSPAPLLEPLSRCPVTGAGLDFARGLWCWGMASGKPCVPECVTPYSPIRE